MQLKSWKPSCDLYCFVCVLIVFFSLSFLLLSLLEFIPIFSCLLSRIWKCTREIYFSITMDFFFQFRFFYTFCFGRDSIRNAKKAFYHNVVEHSKMWKKKMEYGLIKFNKIESKSIRNALSSFVQSFHIE